MTDVGAGHRLLVGHDRQHLERRLRQRLGWRSVQKPFDEWSAVWRGHQLDLVARFEQRESVGWRSSEKGARPIDAARGHAQRRGQLGSAQRPTGHEQQRDKPARFPFGLVVHAASATAECCRCGCGRSAEPLDGTIGRSGLRRWGRRCHDGCSPSTSSARRVRPSSAMEEGDASARSSAATISGTTRRCGGNGQASGTARSTMSAGASITGSSPRTPTISTRSDSGT